MRDPVDRAGRAGTGLVRLSPGLYWYRDTCNVYLLVRGERGLLIDFGSGGILEHLDEAGVRAVDGVRAAFPGGLIAEPGHGPTIHDLQWQYGLPDAVGAALHSVTLLASLPLQRLCPSHGCPTADAPAALRSLERPLRELYGLQAE